LVAYTAAVLAENLPDFAHLLSLTAEFLKRTLVLEKPVRSGDFRKPAVGIIGAEK
jgi:hypothetical protein